MSRYKVSVGTRTYDVIIKRNYLLVNGDRFKFDLESLNGNGLHILRHPKRHIEAYLEVNRHGSYDVQIEGEHVEAQVDFAHRARKHRVGPSSSDLRSQMPGLIVDILVDEGQRVEEDETLLIQEAMKMQMKLCAPCAGTVRALHVTEGKEVEKDVLLVSISPDEPGSNGKPNPT